MYNNYLLNITFEAFMFCLAGIIPSCHIGQRAIIADNKREPYVGLHA